MVVRAQQGLAGRCDPYPRLRNLHSPFRGVSLAIAAGWARYGSAIMYQNLEAMAHSPPSVATELSQGSARGPAHRDAVRGPAKVVFVYGEQDRILGIGERVVRNPHREHAGHVPPGRCVGHLGAIALRGWANAPPSRRGGCAREKCEIEAADGVVVQVQKHFRLISNHHPVRSIKEASRYFT